MWDVRRVSSNFRVGQRELGMEADPFSMEKRSFEKDSSSHVTELPPSDLPPPSTPTISPTAVPTSTDFSPTADVLTTEPPVVSLPLADLLTVIVTTSPIRSHPSTHLMDLVRASFDLIPGLMACRQIIIADGYTILQEQEKEQEKAGKITQGLATRYEGFLVALQKQLDIENSNSLDQLVGHRLLVKRETRKGFAANLKHAVEMCETPYLFVMQHDFWIRRPLAQGVRLEHIIASMQEHACLRYVGLMSTSDQYYEERFLVHQDLKLFKEDYQTVIRDYVRHSSHWIQLRERLKAGMSPLLLYSHSRFKLPLMPVAFWYDKPHICSKQTYLQFVFGQRHLNFAKGQSIEIKNFVEDSLGNVCKANVKRHGYAGFQQYGTYTLYDDPDAPLVGHLDGRSYTVGQGRDLTDTLSQVRLQGGEGRTAVLSREETEEQYAEQKQRRSAEQKRAAKAGAEALVNLVEEWCLKEEAGELGKHQTEF